MPNPESQYWKDIFNFEGLKDPADETSRKSNQSIVSMRLRAYGFSDNVVRLEEFDLTVPLNKNEFYMRKMTGDVVKSAQAIAQALNAKGIRGVDVRESRAIGLYAPLNIRIKEDIYELNIIFVSNSARFENFNTLAGWGHEDGHYLSQRGRRALIYNRFNLSPSIVGEIEDEEDFCSFCGFASIHIMSKKIDKKSWLETLVLDVPKPDLKGKSEAQKQKIYNEIKRAERYQYLLEIAKQVLIPCKH
jgi:hypothetical protein